MTDRAHRLPAILGWTTVVAVLTVLRLLAISDQQVQVAAAIAQSGGVLPTVVGAVVPVLAALLPAGTVALTAAGTVALLVRSALAARLWTCAAIAAVATVLLAPPTANGRLTTNVAAVVTGSHPATVWLLLAAVGAGLFGVVATLRRLDLSQNRAARFTALTLSGFAVVGALAVVAQEAYRPPDRVRALPPTTTGVWLPAERVAPAGPPARIGYVLAVDAGWTTVVWDSDRSIAVLASSQIASRSVCPLDSAGSAVEVCLSAPLVGR